MDIMFYLNDYLNDYRVYMHCPSSSTSVTVGGKQWLSCGNYPYYICHYSDQMQSTLQFCEAVYDIYSLNGVRDLDHLNLNLFKIDTVN